jgi:hypothetical protein
MLWKTCFDGLRWLERSTSEALGVVSVSVDPVSLDAKPSRVLPESETYVNTELENRSMSSD